jgi:hypothetical protein
MKKIFVLMIMVVVSGTIVNGQFMRKVDTTSASKLSYNVSLGSNIGSFGGGLSYFSNYIAPQIQYNQNAKLSFGGGVVVRNTTLNSPTYISNEQKVGALSRNVTQSTLFINGSYRPTERITINAMAYKSMDLNKDAKIQNQLNAFNTNMQGVLFNVDYKITEHTSVNFGFNYSEGGFNPYNQQMRMNNSFLGNGFNSGFGW